MGVINPINWNDSNLGISNPWATFGILRLTELEDVSLPVQEIDEEICKKKAAEYTARFGIDYWLLTTVLN